MSAPTVLRVKRRLEDNPQDALVITCKRIKTDAKELSPSLFVFRGTVENQETTHIKQLVPQNDVKVQTVPNVKDIVEKLRKEHKEVATKSRYEIVNCKRGLKDVEDGEDVYNLVDLQKSDDTDDGIQYAYDVYTAIKQDFDISKVDNFVSIETDLIFDGDGTDTPSGDEADDDDDSNDENNWRNDYPDSEPSSIDEEDMIRAMERVDLGEDLSSDEGEDKIYEDPNEMHNSELYGSGYAKYRARVLKENPDLADGRGLILWAKDKDEESLGYKDDSDDGFYYGQEEDTDQFREQYNSSSDEYSPD
ncbi:probable RNA polymerase II nuclear localization protein SLC7A6OS [Manduca sexta]|uniref:Probable RNA polymerase II nuclear localization protein SLC7A6OS n=1 Tax=Manduca sexta TaxID=7130 RepID=A0A922CQ04_MANSE|nr:probable RNA polymerase II nuclear localization protein SLC7A6OS [Manduca sexta]KAG6454011.1 hypothetical protein O3G_MSEX008456 [Manduca sexta]